MAQVVPCGFHVHVDGDSLSTGLEVPRAVRFELDTDNDLFTFYDADHNPVAYVAAVKLVSIIPLR